MTNSRPLRGSTRPNVDTIVRPSMPSLVFRWCRPFGSMAGMPWGITTGVFVMP
jgi:hypothetical protein